MVDQGVPQDYYFVALGRELGGYLEALRLPPMASEQQVSSRHAQYMQRLQQDEREKRKIPKAQLEYGTLRQQFDEGEVTLQEFEECLDDLVSALLPPEVTSKLAYEKLVAEYEAGQLSKGRYEGRLKNILAPIGLEEVLFRLQAGEITAEDYKREHGALLTRIAEGILTTEEIQVHRAALLADLQGNPITQEEFDALEREWAEEKTKKLTHLNDLKRLYDAQLAKGRECIRRGYFYDDIVWCDMWYHEPVSAPSAANLGMYVTHSAATGEVVVALADELWAEVQGTNRKHWQEQICTWRDELRSMGPVFEIERVKAQSKPQRQPMEPEFPALTDTFSLSIARLDRENVEEIGTSPIRQRKRQELDIKRLLGAFLNDLARQAMDESDVSQTEREALDPSTRPDVGSVEETPSVQELRAVLEALARRAGKDK